MRVDADEHDVLKPQLAVLDLGDVIEFVVDELEQTGFITFGKVKSRNYYGAKMSAINITIPGLFDIDLGWLESQIYPK